MSGPHSRQVQLGPLSIASFTGSKRNKSVQMEFMAPRYPAVDYRYTIKQSPTIVAALARSFRGPTTGHDVDTERGELENQERRQNMH